MRRGTSSAALAGTLAASLAIMAGCGGNSSNGAGSPSASSSATAGASATASASAASSASASAGSSPAAAADKKPITLKVQFAATGPDFEGTDVYNEITKQTGVTMDIELFNEDKFKVELAGGDLPDIIQVKNTGTTYLQQLIQGGSIIPLDDLAKTNGPAIQAPVYAKSLDYSRKFWSNGTGKLYLIPVQVGPSGWGFDQQPGFVTRWDYYKELGYPEIHSIDDMVNVLADMVKKHPTTADGKKVYGTAIWNDWATWGLQSMGLVTGNGFYNVNTGAPANDYTDVEHSDMWDTIQFLYKAQQKGILDPDAFTAKYDDIVAKATQGTLLSSQATWPFVQANADLLKQGPDKGFMTIPLDWGYVYVGGSTVAGWGDRAFAITKNCKDPQRAMDLINFLVSEQGSRLIESGIQGTHWDMVDGKPQMKPEVVQLRAAGGDPWKKTGINMAANQQGLTDFTTASDGSVVNLFDTPEMFASQNNSLTSDYNQHYGVTYPAEAYKKQADAGKVKTMDELPQDVLNAMATAPEDIQRIKAKLDDLITKGAPTVVLKSKDDADYQKRQQDLIKQLNDAGADKYFEWYKQAFADAKAKIEG
ncbi:hypothetical protein [Cohnella zeiphila]|uniref:Extracellular solute-binding protein n=1 Tax=Cohnella zeiphila TaxID=2761120 RepID=A0A7X0VUE0_9BACL|nr:hypothetical protein [Cohnella zeiphila]MBB6730914.1 hypothetical protein [Cohnella zeiphila]